MSLNKVELFKKVKGLWPSQIDLGGMTINGRFIKGGQILVELYESVESSFEENDHWNQIAIWAFHQSMPDYDDEHSIIYIDDITFESFDENMKQNLLGDDCWISEREIYFGLNEGDESGKGSENV